jgi:hypothetical protein
VSEAGTSAETFTIMMTDVEGPPRSGESAGRLADEILGLHGTTVRVQLGRCGGQERQFLGAGSFCPSRHRWPQSGVPLAFRVH